MLNLTACRINRSDEQPLDAAATLTAVGGTLVQGALGTVKPGTGGAGEKFVGVSLAQPVTLLNFPKVETLTANASSVVTLAKTPIGGTLRVIAAEDNSALTAGDPATTATAYAVSNGKTITTHASRVGKAATFFYHFTPSTLEARTLQGDTQPGGAASLTTGTVGVIRAGYVQTTEFDTTVDWSASNPDVRVGANARFTIGGSGAVVPNAQVRQVPSSTDGMLGVYFSA